MAKLTTQTIAPTGLALAFTAAAAGGDTFENEGRTYLHVKNGGASPVTVTVNSIEQCSHGFDHDVVVTVPNAGERIIGPFDPGRFNDKTTGLVGVAYSGVTTVTVAVARI